MFGSVCFKLSTIKEKLEIKAKMEEEMNKCSIIFEVLGLQYFSLNSLTLKNLKDHPSWFRRIHVILTVIVTFLLACYFIILNSDLDVDPNKLTAKNVMTFAIQNTMDVGLIVVFCASFIQAYASTKKIKKIYVNFKEIAQLSQQEFKTTFDFKKLKWHLLKRLFIVVSFFLFLHSFASVIKVKTSKDSFEMLMGGLLLFFLIITSFKYVFYVIMINEQLRFLEKIIQGFVETRPISTIDSLQFQIVNPKPYKSFDNSLLKLIASRKIYNKIYASGNLVNESHGFMILCSIVNLVITLTAQGYKTFVIAVSGMDSHKMIGKDNSFYKKKLIESMFLQRLYICLLFQKPFTFSCIVR